jgi:uncharacterized membrane protein YdcZ (DUF606 family)
MHTAVAAAQPQQQPEPQAQAQARWSRWMLGVTGVVLLVVSIVMMASNAPASRAQTVHRGPAPTQLARTSCLIQRLPPDTC